MNTKKTKLDSFKIESGVPIPAKVGYRYPFGAMAVGDSFLISTKYTRELMGKYLTAGRVWGKNQNPIKRFAVRKTDEGIRIWRIE